MDLTPVLYTKRGRSPEMMNIILEMLGDAYQDFYRELHNSHRACDPECRLKFRTFHLIEHRKLLEIMIHDMVVKRYEYGMGH